MNYSFVEASDKVMAKYLYATSNLEREMKNFKSLRKSFFKYPVKNS